MGATEESGASGIDAGVPGAVVLTIARSGSSGARPMPMRVVADSLRIETVTILVADCSTNAGRVNGVDSMTRPSTMHSSSSPSAAPART